MRGDDLIKIIIVLLLLYGIWYVLTHSPQEFVTKSEFLVAILTIIGAVSAGFWQIWNKLSEISQKIGEILGYQKGKENSKHSRAQTSLKTFRTRKA